jgi:hypothetical protein
MQAGTEYLLVCFAHGLASALAQSNEREPGR